MYASCRLCQLLAAAVQLCKQWNRLLQRIIYECKWHSITASNQRDSLYTYSQDIAIYTNSISTMLYIYMLSIAELLWQTCFHCSPVSNGTNKEWHLGTNLAVQNLDNCSPLWAQWRKSGNPFVRGFEVQACQLAMDGSTTLKWAEIMPMLADMLNGKMAFRFSLVFYHEAGS